MERAAAIREGGDDGDSGPGEFHALVLAAGSATRFGGDKLRAPWAGGRLIDAAVATAKAAAAEVIVLVRPGDGLVDDPGVRVITVADHGEGMGATLRAGARALPADCPGVYVLLGDMPRIPAAVLGALAAAVRGGAPAAAPVHGGRLGHPVLFSAALIPALAAAAGDRGARLVLDGLGDRLARIETADDGVLFDVDRPEHLAATPRAAAAGQDGSGATARSER